MKTFSINDYKIKVDIDEHFIYFYSLKSLHINREMYPKEIEGEKYFWFWISIHGWEKNSEHWEIYLANYEFWGQDVANYINNELKKNNE
jgi:hypothetical protein